MAATAADTSPTSDKPLDPAVLVNQLCDVRKGDLREFPDDALLGDPSSFGQLPTGDCEGVGDPAVPEKLGPATSAVFALYSARIASLPGRSDRIRYSSIKLTGVAYPSAARRFRLLPVLSAELARLRGGGVPSGLRHRPADPLNALGDPGPRVQAPVQPAAAVAQAGHWQWEPRRVRAPHRRTFRKSPEELPFFSNPNRAVPAVSPIMAS